METSPRSNTTLFIICYCFGIFGIHRFMLGRVFTGFLMLITFGGLTIWWGFDIYNIIRGRLKDRKGREIKWLQPTPLENQHQFAGFWIRVCAYIIDVLVIFCLMFPIVLAYTVYVSILASQNLRPDLVIQLLYNLFSFILGISYFTYCHGSKRQATVGKRCVGIYVINSEGEKLSRLHAFGRYFALFLSSITLCIGYMMAGWTKKKQALHDLVAGTYVVYGKPGAIIKP
jgi:uncharacterized RDD family membrane protein YckC